MTRPFIDELMELCEGRGYKIRAVDIDGDVVEVTFNYERNEGIEKSVITKDFRIKEESKV